jgi:glutamine amidotransferase
LVGVLNLVSSNAPALAATVSKIGFAANLINTPSQFSGISHLIIPGNGSIAGVTSEIGSVEFLRDALLDYVKTDRYLLGICLGMQLLGKTSGESDQAQCLELFPFSSQSMYRNSNEFCIPHVGWNQVYHDGNSLLFHQIPSGSDFYFSHSFAVFDSQESIATTKHGSLFSSAVAQGNLYGVQFHPERSQSFGAKLLENFLNLGR